jgi:hypothetical protein
MSACRSAGGCAFKSLSTTARMSFHSFKPLEIAALQADATISSILKLRLTQYLLCFKFEMQQELRPASAPSYDLQMSQELTTQKNGEHGD